MHFPDDCFNDFPAGINDLIRTIGAPWAAISVFFISLACTSFPDLYLLVICHAESSLFEYLLSMIEVCLLVSF